MIEYGSLDQVSHSSYMAIWKHTRAMMELMQCSDAKETMDYIMWLSARGASRREIICCFLYRIMITSDAVPETFTANGYRDEEVTPLRVLLPLKGERYWSQYIPRIAQHRLATSVKLYETEFKLMNSNKREEELYFLRNVLLQMACEWGYEAKLLRAKKKVEQKQTFIDLDMFEENK